MLSHNTQNNLLDELFSFLDAQSIKKKIIKKYGNKSYKEIKPEIKLRKEFILNFKENLLDHEFPNTKCNKEIGLYLHREMDYTITYCLSDEEALALQSFITDIKLFITDLALKDQTNVISIPDTIPTLPEAKNKSTFVQTISFFKKLSKIGDTLSEAKDKLLQQKNKVNFNLIEPTKEKEVKTNRKSLEIHTIFKSSISCSETSDKNSKDTYSRSDLSEVENLIKPCVQ